MTGAVVRQSGGRGAFLRAAAIAALVVLAGVVQAGAHPQWYFATPTWGSLSSPLGWRPDPFDRRVWRHHWGIDIAAPLGTPVIASAPGTVQFTGPYGGYGPLIYLAHPGEWQTLYAHLSRIDVRPGQKVARGTVIGAVGSAGRSTGSHLHFEIRYQGRPVDPLRYLR